MYVTILISCSSILADFIINMCSTQIVYNITIVIISLNQHFVSHIYLVYIQRKSLSGFVIDSMFVYSLNHACIQNFTVIHM